MKEYRDFRKGIWTVEILQDENNVSKKILEYSVRDFYGPTMQFRETIIKGKIPQIEPLPDTYMCDETSVSAGAEKLAEQFSTEYYKKKGKFYLISKFGTILINSEKTGEIIKDFKCKIRIF